MFIAGVQAVLANPQHLNLGSTQLKVKEYYPFMKSEETDVGTPTQPISAQPQAPRRIWNTLREKLSVGRCKFARRSLNSLNEKLEQIKAKAMLDEGQTLCVNPLEEASNVDDWEDKAKEIFDEHFANYREDFVQIAKEAKAEVLSYAFAEDRRPSGIDISLQGECLSIRGSQEQVQKVMDEINDMILSAQISTRDVVRPRKHLRFLLKLCLREMKNAAPPDVDFDVKVDQGVIRVTANPKDFAAFEAMVEEQLKTVNESTIDLSPTLYELFSSKGGEAKIAEVVGIELPRIIYDFEESHDDYILCILSKDKELCRSVRKQLLPYTQSRAIEVNQQKIRVCTDKKWRELTHELTSEHFVNISFYDDTSKIVVEGEVLTLDAIIKKIEKFLRDHTSIEERMELDRNVWNVVHLNFAQEMSALESDAKSRHVTITWPRSGSRKDALSILIRGEPKYVDDFKVRVQMLGMKVCHKQATISQVPALVHVLGSMDDRINVLRAVNKASIELHFEKGTVEESQATGELPRKLCNATAPTTGSRVNVYMGDFTQNQPVTAILNFVSLDPSIHLGPLKLLASTAGQEMQDDFKAKLSQLLVRRPGVCFKTLHGQLRCSQLVHCFLPPWNQTSAATMVQNLEEGLKSFLRGIDSNSSILVTPITSKPLEYPVDVFSEKLLEVCGSLDIQVTVYVDEIDQARVFEELLTDQKFMIHTHVPAGQTPKPATSLKSPTSSLTSARAISNPIKSFISLTQGDMLKQQVSAFMWSRPNVSVIPVHFFGG